MKSKEREAIDELLVRAARYDDKPHMLYSQIQRMAKEFCDDPRDSFDVIEKMEVAYQRRGRSCNTQCGIKRRDVKFKGEK